MSYSPLCSTKLAVCSRRVQAEIESRRSTASKEAMIYQSSPYGRIFLVSESPELVELGL
jgi:hypothetical protein